MKNLSVLILKANFILALTFAGTLLFTGCSKDNSNSTPATNTTPASSTAISNDDMTQAVTNAVSESSSGMATQSETAARIVSFSNIACGATSDTTISGASRAGAILAYSYNLNFSRTCICTNGVPSQYNTNISGTSSYSAILMSSEDTTTAQISVSGVQASSANYIQNGTYTRKGTLNSLMSNQSFIYTLIFTATNITVEKSTNKIASGAANVQFTGTNFSGAAFNRTASVTFLGNNQATLVLDNGKSSTISW